MLGRTTPPEHGLPVCGVGHLYFFPEGLGELEAYPDAYEEASDEGEACEGPEVGAVGLYELLGGEWEEGDEVVDEGVELGDGEVDLHHAGDP